MIDTAVRRHFFAHPLHGAGGPLHWLAAAMAQTLQYGSVKPRGSQARAAPYASQTGGDAAFKAPTSPAAWAHGTANSTTAFAGWMYAAARAVASNAAAPAKSDGVAKAAAIKVGLAKAAAATGGGSYAAIAAIRAAQSGNTSDSPAFQRQFLQAQTTMSPAQLNEVRAELQVVLDGGPDSTAISYPPVSAFEEISVLPDYTFNALQQMSISTPMPIQSQALPIILGGHDLVGVARTGSGKTLAYLLPAVVHIEAQAPLKQGEISPIALALAPTRELAVQIAEQAQKLVALSAEGNTNHPGGLWASCIYGGMSKAVQLKNSMGAHIVAATPGRLMDHVQKGELLMHRVTYFVLDEGDRMLDDGFESDVKSIASAIRTDRQMLFFSATWPKKVQDLAKYMCQGAQPPVRLRIGQSTDGSATTRQDIMQEVVVFEQETWEERDEMKQALLYHHVREALGMEGAQVLVFVSRKTLADEMATLFGREGIVAESMHGGRSQDVRLHVLEKFKSGEVRLLVATDVMGRGLDIPTISHVVIYDMGDIDDYVHRVGRTCRGPYGRGHALTLFEYNNKWPHLAEGLIACLEKAGQEVPGDLRNIAWEVSAGWREVKQMKAGSKWGEHSGWQGSAHNVAWKKLGYDKSSSADAFGWQSW